MPRHTSTSSDDEDDSANNTWLQETSVIKSVRKNLNTDDWPVFDLRDAVILDADGEELVNGLEAETRGPFIVRGTLAIESNEDKTHLLMRRKRSFPIEIRQCIMHSIGETGDGGPLIWVSGRGGWYEVTPSEEYRSTFMKMCEAVTLYYTILDVHAELSSKSKSKAKVKAKSKKADDSLDSVLFKYVSKIGDASTLQDAKLRCHEHARFLLFKFLSNGDEVSEIQNTPFYEWLIEVHQDLSQEIKDRIKNPLVLSRHAISTAAEASGEISRRSSGIRGSTSKGSDGKEFPIRQRRSESRAAKQKEHEDSESSANESAGTDGIPLPVGSPAEEDVAFQSVLQAVKDAYAKLEATAHGPSFPKLLNAFYFDYKLPTYKGPTPGSHKEPAREVLHYNASRLLDALDKNAYAGIYPQLKELSKQKFKLQALRSVPFTVVPRKRKDEPSTKPQDVTVQTPVRSHHGSKTPGRRPASTLRPVKTIKKRPLASVDTDEEMTDVSRRRSMFITDEDESMAGVESSDDSDGSPCPPTTGIPSLSIETTLLPSTEKKGLDNTWVCAQDGCDDVIRGGDDLESPEKIQQHLRKHENEDARVDLAIAESRSYLPVQYDSLLQPPSLPQPSLSAPGPQLWSMSSCPLTGIAYPVIPLQSSSDVERGNFSRFVNQFWRQARPVSDKLYNLTSTQ